MSDVRISYIVHINSVGVSSTSAAATTSSPSTSTTQTTSSLIVASSSSGTTSTVSTTVFAAPKLPFEITGKTGWRSRPYAQPLLIEELMMDSLSAPQHVKVDRITQSLSHCVSLVAALDAVELSHDEELESTRLKLQRLEDELEAQKKLTAEVRIVARGAHSQVGIYEARVVDLENEITSRDTTIAELRRTVETLEQGRLDLESRLSQDKVEVLQRLSEYRASSSKREEALQVELVEVHRAMREAADSFATEKKNLEESRTHLSLSLAQLSVMPAFPGDPEALARKCIGAAMAYLHLAHEEGSRFKVLKEKRSDFIYQFLVKELGPHGIHLPHAED
ncbi:hypothetical protein CJ030_MR7G014300 [Morella rubra]|uniref:Uncharacterized protein n=1 Tax=Morella rubra TaxID=262757 RepID=A0A6A1V0G9_9ROSI|nr:hypothetical protein CJ030_MR7G014300 [Morella rubra]